MEKYIRLFVYTSALFLVAACTNDKDPIPEDDLSITGISLAIGNIDSGTVTKAPSDYAVNSTDDPTNTMTGRETWELYFELTGVAVEGNSTFSWNGSVQRWEPDDPIYFPDYERKTATFSLYPVGWNNVIATDQRATGGSALFAQDVLEQNGTSGITVFPAHILEVEARHANSMLDFKFNNITGTDIQNVEVIINNTSYQPYQVKAGNSPEYMLIVPTGISEPVIRITTVGGANYYQTTVDGINNTQPNTCYCFTFAGLELLLGEITISDWLIGPGINGEYTTETSYPTFRGPANGIATLFFDNGLEQSLIFNDQGEATVKPNGRTIIGINVGNGYTDVTPPIVLGSMSIDLTAYFN